MPGPGGGAVGVSSTSDIALGSKIARRRTIICGAPSHHAEVRIFLLDPSPRRMDRPRSWLVQSHTSCVLPEQVAVPRSQPTIAFAAGGARSCHGPGWQRRPAASRSRFHHIGPLGSTQLVTSRHPWRPWQPQAAALPHGLCSNLSILRQPLHATPDRRPHVVTRPANGLTPLASLSTKIAANCCNNAETREVHMPLMQRFRRIVATGVFSAFAILSLSAAAVAQVPSRAETLRRCRALG